MIKWILFDQAQVQTHNVFSSQDSYSINGKSFNSSVLESIFHTKLYNDYKVGKITEALFITKFIQDKNLDLTVQEYIELCKKGIRPILGVEELLAELKERFNLASLINEGSEWAQYKLDISGFRKYFMSIIISGDIGFAKPDKNFYLRSLEIIKARPEECIFTDDKEENCAGAQSVGINSIVFENPKQFKNKLEGLCIS